jgi:hypothetical protein
LRELQLNNNLLSGGLPREFGLPGGSLKTQRVQSAQTLEVFDASQNQLSGGIPVQWSSMTALRELRLANCGLSGSLSAALALGWSGLEVLRLEGNTFSGNLPSGWNVSRISVWNIAGNGFTGAFPEEFARAARLGSINVASNRLSSFPTLSSARRLDTLILAGNRLDFANLEANAVVASNAGTTVFSYSPQDSLGQPSRRTVQAGEELQLTATGGGARTRYEWQNNGRTISAAANPTASAATLVLANVSRLDSGAYTSRMTSPVLLPGLVLFTRPIAVQVSGGAGGTEFVLATTNLIFPTFNAENIAPRPRFRWERVANADGYDVQVSTGADERGIVQTVSVTQVPASVAEVSIQAGAQAQSLERGQLYFWRVVSRAAGLATSSLTAWAPFRIVPLGQDVAVSSLALGRTSIGSTVEGETVVVNVGMSAVRVSRLAVQSGSEVFQATLQTSDSLLAAGSALRLAVSFTPKQESETRGTVEVAYTDALGTSRTVAFNGVLSGFGSALKVDALAFDTVRVGKTTLRTLRVINVGTKPFTLANVRLQRSRTSSASDQDVFSVRNIIGADAAPSGTQLMKPTDTVYVVVACSPLDEGRKATIIEVASEVETVRAAVTAVARLVRPGDAALALAVTASTSETIAGSAVTVRLMVRTDDRTALLAAAQPIVRGRLIFDSNVMTLADGRAVRVDTVGRLSVPFDARWDGAGASAVVTLQCRAVAGVRSTTLVEIADVNWGGVSQSASAGAIASERFRQPWERGVFIEGLEAARVTVKPSMAGGERRITTRRVGVGISNGQKPTAQLALLRPNPAKDEVEIVYTLSADEVITLELVRVTGEVAKVICTNQAQTKGEYLLRVRIAEMPSGAYSVRLITPSGSVSQRLDVVR